MKDRVDEAWQSIKAGLIRGVSIGYLVLQGGVERLKNGARKLTKTEICELSLVTIPRNRSASIRLIKAQAKLQETRTMTHTTTEHVSAFENKRAALAARMIEIMQTAAADGETLGS